MPRDSQGWRGENLKYGREIWISKETQCWGVCLPVCLMVNHLYYIFLKMEKNTVLSTICGKQRHIRKLPVSHLDLPVGTSDAGTHTLRARSHSTDAWHEKHLRVGNSRKTVLRLSVVVTTQADGMYVTDEDRCKQGSCYILPRIN